ncbi:hypothetical protein CYMTET_16746 [Cymbomonas tetramitiformis]|uniref:Uncharacterized protein n=1 Tax=Cymbomonas tetramitiformis TaxID=36881 RepID=A0AAE0GBH3_9CHLO|nr:hypothetical protein CYMTET_16746 [Cymbomonas tetramitiformis]
MQASKGPLHKLYWHCGITEWDVQLQDWTEDGLVKQLEQHDPKTFQLPKGREQVYERLSKGDWANVNDWQLFGGEVKSGKWFPVWSFLTSVRQMQIKAEVLQTNRISYANDYATHWSVATMRQDTWDLIVKIMHAYGECILKGQTKTPTKGSSKKRKIWAPDSEIVDMTTETSGAEEALKDPAQPLQQAIVKESEKKELGMPVFQNMLGFHSDVEVDYLNGVLKKILTTEITIQVEAIKTLKRFKNQRNVQAWIHEKEYEQKTVQTGYMIYKDELTKLEYVPKLHYVGTILDVIYDFDTEVSEHALSEADLIKFINAFAALTTSPDWTILIFCGFAQQTGFLKILESKCNGGAQRIWWRKENQDVGANKAIRYNVLEAAVIGFQMADVESGEKSTRKPWMCDFDFSTKEAEASSRANLLEGYSVVKQPFKDNGRVVCAHQKPQHLLMDLINCHMMGPAPFARLNNDSSPNWILDAGCGVATATMAALRCGLNAVAFDSDQDMVQAASQRLGNITDEPTDDTECMSLEETAKLKEDARIEEENLQKAAQAREIAECAADLDDLMDGDGEEGATPKDEGEQGEGEAGEGASGDNDPSEPAEDAPAE